MKRGTPQKEETKKALSLVEKESFSSRRVPSGITSNPVGRRRVQTGTPFSSSFTSSFLGDMMMISFVVVWSNGEKHTKRFSLFDNDETRYNVAKKKRPPQTTRHQEEEVSSSFPFSSSSKKVVLFFLSGAFRRRPFCCWWCWWCKGIAQSLSVKSSVFFCGLFETIFGLDLHSGAYI